ncbi:MAG: hypothetical protein EXR05_02695 [Acetobacteraceae bacterium]|nr:hypothetical protein [Acetobacteraceae bacterium]MSP28901.1 hypothetical protein [Acetobacteraceae bacterium]
MGRHLLTQAGEVDAVGKKGGPLAITRSRLPDGAGVLSAQQRMQLLGATEILLAGHPGLGRMGVRLDALLADAAGTVRRIADAFRQEWGRQGDCDGKKFSVARLPCPMVSAYSVLILNDAGTSGG